MGHDKATAEHDGDGSPYSGFPSNAVGLTVPDIDVDRLPPALLRELRASHVGETVAVALYDGVAAGSRDPDLLTFARSHRLVEQVHLRLWSALLPPGRRSRIMPVWRASGRLMGWLPARAGPEAFYAVVGAVESWVDGHYAGQIALSRRLGAPEGLIALMQACREDEARHSRDAARLACRPGVVARLLAALAVAGSRAGVAVARWV
ncbi:demethoxyubiquinone hydroxylase family protein [Rhodocista pekingensis]|uniref:Demethoxyubiquinone hydroxylase family protein n=1 Tax=Rhodocista pekingensis TaxID=201185 RepID=A0ABW2KZM3_9PROT